MQTGVGGISGRASEHADGRYVLQLARDRISRTYPSCKEMSGNGTDSEIRELLCIRAVDKIIRQIKRIVRDSVIYDQN